MNVTQISVFLENRAGQLSNITRVLSENGVDLRAINIAETADYGVLRLIPADPVVMLDLEGALKLEFYKLEQTFKGDIALIDKSVPYEPAKAKGKAVPEQKEPLAEVIEKINQLFNGNFGEADRVLLYALHDKLKSDIKLEKMAKSSNPQVFTESVFPKTFETVAQDSYVEQTEAFTSLFQNKSKYNAIMAALAEMLYREFNASNSNI